MLISKQENDFFVFNAKFIVQNFQIITEMVLTVTSTECNFKNLRSIKQRVTKISIFCAIMTQAVSELVGEKKKNIIRTSVLRLLTDVEVNT